MGLIEQGMTTGDRASVPRIIRATLITAVLAGVILVAAFAMLRVTAGPAQTIGTDARLPGDTSQALVEAHRGAAAPWIVAAVDSYDRLEHNRLSH
jgi:hypothetical protein